MPGPDPDAGQNPGPGSDAEPDLAADHGQVLEGNAGRQRRLAAITEIIHTASLIHDDVLDAADTRRGVRPVGRGRVLW